MSGLNLREGRRRAGESYALHVLLFIEERIASGSTTIRGEQRSWITAR
tara:strand:- start:515 stop:658 length:144 start_codon:yes stop_codon:yes gene_type:complete